MIVLEVNQNLFPESQGKYFVTLDGKVYSRNRRRFIKDSVDGNLKSCVRFSDKKTYRTSRVIFFTALPNHPYAGTSIYHINGLSNDNAITNLTPDRDDIQRKPYSAKFTDNEKKIIEKLCRKGCSIYEIADSIKRSSVGIRQYLIKNGLHHPTSRD